MGLPNRETTDAFARRRPGEGSARVLVVSADTEGLAALVGLLEQRRHHCTRACRLDEARTAVKQGRYDLVVLNPVLPDGDGLELVPLLKGTSPATKTILLLETGAPDTAIAADCGVFDILTTPVDLTEFATRVDAALSPVQESREERIARLRKLCAQLEPGGNETAQQVQTLCHELVAAYQDMTEEIDHVTLTTEFRTLLQQELDVEDVLRTALEYLLTKTAPTNAAVFLPDADQRYGLAAYVNYDCPRESVTVLLDHLALVVCPHMAQEPEIIVFNDTDEFADWIGPEMGFLVGCEVVAFSCLKDGECLAVVILFRSRNTPFEEEFAPILEIMREIFAEQLAHVLKIHHRATPQWPADTADDPCDSEDDFGFGPMAA